MGIVFRSVKKGALEKFFRIKIALKSQSF